jgi:hypothetical protein
MKRTLALSSSILLALSCAKDVVPPPTVGGQSGDDGDVTPPGGPPSIPPEPPGIPDLPCDATDDELPLEAASAFGGNALELLAALAPEQSLPLLWAQVDAPAGTAFTPSAAQTTLQLGFSARAGASAQQRLWQPRSAEAVCPDDTLRVPVSVSLRSSDGAFAEQLDSELEFTSGSSARLRAQLPATLSGSFSFDQIGTPGEVWQLNGFVLALDLWPGGSRGEITPDFSRVQTGPATPPSEPSVAPMLTSPGAAPPTPTLPSRSSAIAVWPRREICANAGGGTAASATDKVIGWSVVDVVNDLNSRPDWTLASAGQTTPVQFTLTPPTGLLCLNIDGRTLRFDAVARLRAGAAPGSALEHLDATSTFELTVRSTRDGAGLESVHWVRRDMVYAQARSAFEAATGLSLTAPAEYRQIWWSWHGTATHGQASAAWSGRAELVVSSPNAAQTAEFERVQAQGGPGPGVAYGGGDTFPILPGDSLIDASTP